MSKVKCMLTAILDAVSAETDVPVAKIMSKSRETEVVDARHICVRLLHDYGLYASKIAELLGLSPRAVQYVLTDFDDRTALCALMRTNYETLAKRFGKGCEAKP